MIGVARVAVLTQPGPSATRSDVTGVRNKSTDPGFLFNINSNRGSICNRLDVLREAGVEIVFLTSAEIERSRKFDLLLWRHFLT